MKYGINANLGYGKYSRELPEGYVECAPRPSVDHVINETWETAPLDPLVCWRLKTSNEIDAEKDEQVKDRFISEREDTLLMLFYLADKQLRVLQSKPPIDKETFWGQIKNVHKNQQFFDGTF